MGIVEIRAKSITSIASWCLAGKVSIEGEGAIVIRLFDSATTFSKNLSCFKYAFYTFHNVDGLIDIVSPDECTHTHGEIFEI